MVHNPNILNEEVGLLKRGAIESFDQVRNVIKVKLNVASATSSNPSIDVPAPHSLFYNNGLYIGTRPKPGTPVVVGQGSGGQYYFVSYLAENLPILPMLNMDELLIRSNENTAITLNLKNDIKIGSNNTKVHINTGSINYISSSFNNQFNFTQAAKRIEGIVRRDRQDKIINLSYDSDNKLQEDNYAVIGMDPSTTPNSITTGSTKNPPFVEQREMLYEFQLLSEIDNDLIESQLYAGTGINTVDTTYLNRRKSRSDTLSLTLQSPNYLMETVKGTVIDIFGNILDLNRIPIPIGQDQNTIRADKTADKVSSFIRIKELERKSLAYHFEINARKDLTDQNGKVILPDINSNADYARNRSRFFMDIDKEGQFKINVPASSETGNIPLLTRYENYSTFGPEDNNNPNKLIFREDNLDIFQDSFAAPTAKPINEGFLYSNGRGSIEIKDEDGYVLPKDRITGEHLKHGMAYHDVLQTCYVHQDNKFLNYQAGTSRNTTVNLKNITPLEDVVSKIITVAGPAANAGGRSGSFSLDGSLELNIGANTIDRQSLWADLAGGMVMNVGRDIRNRSAMISMNGDVYMQIGGFGVFGDSRFAELNNGSYGAVLDLRVVSAGGYTNMIRVDKNGITVMSPGNISIHAKGNLKMSSDANIEVDCESLILQGRLVKKTFGGSI